MPSRGIELGETENIHFCPAVENHRHCEHKPRWIEEDWSVQRIENLMRARADLHYRFDSFDRDHRIARSKALMHGQVCVAHGDHVRRLHTLNMIRGDARSDLRGSRHSTARTGRTRTARARAARKRVVRTARAMSPEQGRSGGVEMPDDFGDRSPSPPSELTLTTEFMYLH